MDNAYLKQKHDMIVAIHAQIDAEHAAEKGRERSGFAMELVLEIGGKVDLDAEPPVITLSEEQLTTFLRRGEGAGRFTYARRAGHSLSKTLSILAQESPQPTPPRKIVPVRSNGSGYYFVAPGPVLAVFDSTGDGTLVEVPFRPNPIDNIEFQLVCAPYGQVYAEIENS